MPDEDDVLAPWSERIWKAYKIPLILSSASLLLIAFSLTLLVKSVQTTEPIKFSQTAASDSGKPRLEITVDIEGAVNRPGIYRLSAGSRVEDVIAAAGEFSAEADRDQIARTLNRAAVLVDGAKIFIPSVNASSNQVTSNGGTVAGSSLVSVNSASQAELEALPGIGPVTAGKIIAGRPYQTLSELVTKKALSQSLFTKLQNQLSL